MHDLSRLHNAEASVAILKTVRNLAKTHAALPVGNYGIVKDTVTSTHDVANQAKTEFSMQAPPAPYRIVITSDPPFSLTTYGISDPRELGVQARVASGDWVLSR